MVLAFAEREEAENLLSCLSTLVLCVAALKSQDPIELDTFQRCEIIAGGILCLQFERLRSFFQVKISRRCVHVKRVDNVKNDIASEDLSCFLALGQQNRRLFSFFAGCRCYRDFVGAVFVVVPDWLNLDEFRARRDSVDLRNVMNFSRGYKNSSRNLPEIEAAFFEHF